MFIPSWLLIIGVIVAYFIYKSREAQKDPEELSNVEEIEEKVCCLKDSIFERQHFDGPNFIDNQDAFDAMETNYLRLKQRLSHSPEKILETVRDWHRYAYALDRLRSARVMLDADWSDQAYDNMQENVKEPYIIKEEVEKKFKSLLGKDWQKIPPDYHEREKTMKKPSKKVEKELGLGNVWKYYYSDSPNLWKLEELRQKKENNQKVKE